MGITQPKQPTINEGHYDSYIAKSQLYNIC